MEQQRFEQVWEPRPYLAVTPECFEDPDDPGLCEHHEVVHLENGNDFDWCGGREVPRRL